MGGSVRCGLSLAHVCMIVRDIVVYLNPYLSSVFPAHARIPLSLDEQDGPTHQPVETVSGLRVFPNMDVMRPADPEETAAAYAASLDRKDGPTALILTRQNVRTLKEIPVRENFFFMQCVVLAYNTRMSVECHKA